MRPGGRALPPAARRRSAAAGAAARGDRAAGAAATRRCRPAPQRIEPSWDPDPTTAPAPLVSSLEPRVLDTHTWVRLRALDRYALLHEHRRGVAKSDPERVGAAFDRIVAARGLAGARSPDVPRPPVVPDLTLDAGAPASDRDAPPPSSRPEPGLGRYSERPNPPPLPGRPAPRPPRSPWPDEPAAPGPAAISTHLDRRGDVHMVDVHEKPVTHRRAVATGAVRMRPETASRVARGEAAKGEVLATARLAGIMAAKRTPEIVPLCHAVALTRVAVQVEIDEPNGLAFVTATAEAMDRTGVEMEALVAASAACLTIYDMLKGVDRDMVIESVKLLEKSGGRSGSYSRRER